LIALKILWRKLLDQYVERFGLSENILAIHRKEKEIANLMIQKISNDDRSLNLFIKIAQEELEAMKSKDEKGSFYELKGMLDRAGFDIHPMETSAAEFYTHIQTLVKQSKDGRRAN